MLALGLGDSIVETSVSPKSMSYKRLLQEYPEEMAKIQKKQYIPSIQRPYCQQIRI